MDKKIDHYRLGKETQKYTFPNDFDADAPGFKPIAVKAEELEYDEKTTKTKEIKPRPDLVPPEAILAVSEILAFGAEKHGARSWEKGMAWSDNYAACQRHLLKWYSGENLDPETGRSHLWHAATRIFFLIGSEARNIGTDDRPKCSTRS
jgi:hypothetical protein